ncbi:heterogeneous nuclear ribonucleoprotein A1-like [Ylistrum balloti]|uniref:heterogeneous nuclear ribonucleoprotein A1-like n=1 Tax=Ylistrum balloti TaxID=509963 RepID=UPI002905CC6C|nr:heterogeneous nuclear ribonucleoprotein A1-like [Ylistrum balloti]
MGDRENEQFRKLFIGGLSYETTEDSLKTHFAQWGNIIDCVVMKDAHTKRSRGFGFITYSTPEELDEAQKSRPHRLDGRQVESKRAMPRNKDGGEGESSQSCKKMFVGGIADDATEDQLREVFGVYGDIERVDLIKDKVTGKNKRFCFVTFFDYDPVDQCVLKKKHDVNGRSVEVKKAVPREQDGGMGGRGGGRGGMMGGRGGGRGGMMGGGRGGRNDWDQGGGYNQQGGYNDYNQGGGYNSGGGDYNQNWNQGGGGGYDNYNSGYNQNQNSGGNWGGNQQQNFGQNYGDGYGGGAMRGGGSGGNYQQRSGPYSQGQGNYNRGGGGGGGGGGYNRR